MKKKSIMLSCITVVAIAMFVGTKTFESNAYETNGLLVQNVEALSQGDGGDGGEGASRGWGCFSESKTKKGYTFIRCTDCYTPVYDEMGKGTEYRCP